YVSLPTPSDFSKLSVPQDEEIWVGKSDLSDFYYHISIPEWMSPFFCMPWLLSDELGPDVVRRFGSGVRVYPALRVLAMGWSHSVYVAQSIHEFILNNFTSLRSQDRITSSSDYLLDRLRHFVYIDDVGIFGTDRELVNRVLDEYMDAVKRIGFHVKPKKV